MRHRLSQLLVGPRGAGGGRTPHDPRTAFRLALRVCASDRFLQTVFVSGSVRLNGAVMERHLEA